MVTTEQVPFHVLGCVI